MTRDEDAMALDCNLEMDETRKETVKVLEYRESFMAVFFGKWKLTELGVSRKSFQARFSCRMARVGEESGKSREKTQNALECVRSRGENENHMLEKASRLFVYYRLSQTLWKRWLRLNLFLLTLADWGCFDTSQNKERSWGISSTQSFISIIHFNLFPRWIFYSIYFSPSRISAEMFFAERTAKHMEKRSS